MEPVCSSAIFQSRVQDFLLEREAANNLFFEVIDNARETTANSYMAVVERSGVMVQAAVRTPPQNLVLSRGRDDTALDALVTDLESRDVSLPGVHGPRDEAAGFAGRWQVATGRSPRPRMLQRVYQLTEVIPVPGVPGAPRLADDSDRDLLMEWSTSFIDEALPGEQHPATAWVSRQLNTPNRGVLLWEVDGEAVSMASYGGPTPNGIRIGGVYTPPQQRGNGYARSTVAALSLSLLTAGRTFCFLFADQANPTSNHIYQQIGFRPVGDAIVYVFD